MNRGQKIRTPIEDDVYRVAAKFCPLHMSLNDYINEALHAGLEADQRYHEKEGYSEGQQKHMEVRDRRLIHDRRSEALSLPGLFILYFLAMLSRKASVLMDGASCRSSTAIQVIIEVSPT